MIRTADIRAHLVAQGVAEEIRTDGDIPDMPDELVVITPAGGLDTTHERLFDRSSIQIRVRGRQADDASAEALATEVDTALMGPARFTLGGRPVKSVQYIGGPPTFVGRDPSGRVELTCNYLIEVARD